MEMNLAGAQERVQSALKALDTISANGTLRVFGLYATQQMAGIVGILNEILAATEMKKPSAEEISEGQKEV